MAQMNWNQLLSDQMVQDVAEMRHRVAMQQMQLAMDSQAWTGRSNPQFGAGGGGHGGGASGGNGGGGGGSVSGFMVLEPPSSLDLDLREDAAVIEKPVAVRVKATKKDVLKEYEDLAKEVGFHCPELVLASFKSFLEANDIPVYDLKTVKAYMDDKCAKEGKDGGWVWHPMRSIDKEMLANTNFGRRGEWPSSKKYIPASDYYLPSHLAYDKPIPLHALKKVALINKSDFKDKVGLVVTDYQAKPEYRPDPFLMVVIPNSRIREGVGRFIIDFWDEPGFGLMEQLA